jgi:hypothetical protein
MIPPTVAIIGNIATLSAAAAPVTALINPRTGDIAATKPRTVTINACVLPSSFPNHDRTETTIFTSFSNAGTRVVASEDPAEKNACVAVFFSLSI